jgi:hypothetical protein
MALYRFNLVDGATAILDQHGLEVSDEARLRTETVTALRELAKEEPQLDWRGWRLEVVDQCSGRTVFSVAIDDFLISRPITH